MTPYELRIALHYHTHVDDYSDNGQIVDDALKWFLDNGLLVRHICEQEGEPFKRAFDPTPRLHAFCELLCATPLPVQIWVHPDKTK